MALKDSFNNIKLKDIVIGSKINRWTVLGIKNINGRKYFNCVCECGTVKDVYGYNLIKSKSISCGCYNNEKNSEINSSHKHSGERIYRTWKGIKARCYNKNFTQYNDYGGRGIIMCDEWKSDFMNFYNWSMNNGYDENLEIDRINIDGNYEPSNCQFVTTSENLEVGKKRKMKNNTSGYVGVSFNKKAKLWKSQIGYNSECINLGYFKNINEAVEVRIAKEIELFGEQRTNFNYNRQ